MKQHNVYNDIAQSFSHTRFAIWACVGQFLSSIPKHNMLLDVGCGNGKYASVKKDIIWHGCDITPNLLAIAKEKNSNVCLADGQHLPFADKSFDHTMSIAVIHHLTTPQQRHHFMKELIRVTKQEVLVTVWADEQPKKPKWRLVDGTQTDYMIPWQDDHWRYYHLFTRDEMTALLEGLGVTFELQYERDNWCARLRICA